MQPIIFFLATFCFSFGSKCSRTSGQQSSSALIDHDFFPSTDDIKIAIMGDQGLGNNSVAVLKMIKSWEADLVIIPGDFDYVDNPKAFFGQFNDAMGLNFPLLAVPGNHDILCWFDEENGYKVLLNEQLTRSGMAKHCTGDMGINSYCLFNDIIIILSGVGTLGTDHAQYIDNTLTNHQNVTWKICVWHKNQAKLQTGDKEDETGYGVYEACRKHGAVIFTGHEHSYERSHLLSVIKNI
jgi:3',5'-cyclic AMP phosphodiesterase CpdA